MYLDDVDVKIINLLQKDCRISYREIARKLSIATGTAKNRIERLEREGVIKGYYACINSNKVGMEFAVITFIQVEGGHLVDVEKEVAKVKNVCSVYDITGEFDAAVIAKFKNRESLDSFIKSISAIPYVRRTVTSVVLNIVKEDPRIEI
jgi:DNA-binding Lrp family transcriptional regulator